MNKGGSSIDKKTGYWDIPLSEEQKETLDLDLIEELNQAFDEEDIPPQKPQRDRKTPAVRFIGLIIIVSFMIISVGSYFKADRLPSLHFLSQSGVLKQSPEVQVFQEAVVMIDTIQSKGTGFNIDAAGLIVTNAHVVDDAEAVLVKFSQGKIYPSTEWVSFPEVDLALIKIKGENLPKLDLAENGGMKPGSKVMIIGNPLGFPFVASQGTVSGQILLNKWTEPVLKIESYIYQGSSGSPVLNSRGEVVGIVFAVLEKSQSNEKEKATGFAVSVDSLKKRWKADP